MAFNFGFECELFYALTAFRHSWKLTIAFCAIFWIEPSWDYLSFMMASFKILQKVNYTMICYMHL